LREPPGSPREEIVLRADRAVLVENGKAEGEEQGTNL